MINKTATFILILLFIGCAEDIQVNNSASEGTLQHFVDESVQSVSIGVFSLQTGNHPSFEEEVDNHPVLAILDAPDSAYDFRLYLSDSLRFPDSLGTFQRILMDVDPEMRGIFRLFRLRDIKQDRFMRATYRVGDSIRMSVPITLRNGSLRTKDIDAIMVEETEETLNLNWESVAGSDLYLVTIKDAFGDIVSSLYTYRNSFRFYDLRFAARNLLSTTIDTKLEAGSPYEIEVMAISRRGWINAIGNRKMTLGYGH